MYVCRNSIGNINHNYDDILNYDDKIYFIIGELRNIAIFATFLHSVTNSPFSFTQKLLFNCDDDGDDDDDRNSTNVSVSFLTIKPKIVESTYYVL